MQFRCRTAVALERDAYSGAMMDLASALSKMTNQRISVFAFFVRSSAIIQKFFRLAGRAPWVDSPVVC
jgi:hypothetical protein